MFNDTKSLIIVYKDEMLLNQIRKLIETKDDTEDGIVGVKDGSVKIVSWNEKMWLSQKKNGTINNKVLFIDEIKETDQLIPILDVKFEKHGVMYGWAGNQAVLTCDPKKLSENEYQEFLKEIESLDIPETIKKANRYEDKCDSVESDNKDEHATDEAATEIVEVVRNEDAEAEKKNAGFFDKLKKVAGEVADIGAEKIGEAFDAASKGTEELKRNITRDRTAMKRQLLFYGIINLYNNDLEKFLNS